MRIILLALLLTGCAHRQHHAVPPVLEVTYWACESGERQGVTHCRYVVEDGKTVDFKRLEIRVVR